MRSSEKNSPKRIYDDLKNQIQDGKIAVGERLPTERQLAVSYGVAVLTLRKALASLRREGWIVSRKYHGTHAANPANAEARNVIGLIIPYGLQTLSHPVFSRLVDGVEGIVSERGYELRLGVSAPANPTREKVLLESVEDPIVRGWLVPTIISDAVRESLRKQTSEKVLLHFPDEKLSEHCLEVDYFAVAMTLLNHLAPQGYRNIRYIGPDSSTNVQNALTALAGSSMVGADLKVSVSVTPDHTTKSGRAAALEALRSGGVDVFVCADDELAVGALQALTEKGLRAPGVGVIGAGDFPFGVMTSPPLSTISYPYFQVGRQATQLLIDLIEGKNVEPAHRRFVPKFIARESSLLASKSEPIDTHE